MAIKYHELKISKGYKGRSLFSVQTNWKQNRISVFLLAQDDFYFLFINRMYSSHFSLGKHHIFSRTKPARSPYTQEEGERDYIRRSSSRALSGDGVCVPTFNMIFSGCWIDHHSGGCSWLKRTCWCQSERQPPGS